VASPGICLLEFRETCAADRGKAISFNVTNMQDYSAVQSYVGFELHAVFVVKCEGGATQRHMLFRNVFQLERSTRRYSPRRL
jgi:hypothetical protein